MAWREFGLSASDLRELPSMHRLGVVFDSSSVTRLFNKFELQDAAIEKFKHAATGRLGEGAAVAVGSGTASDETLSVSPKSNFTL